MSAIGRPVAASSALRNRSAWSSGAAGQWRRKIRPIIEDKVGTYLFRTEVFERNVYKDIHNGIGTLQMQEVTEAIAKARRETQALVEEVDALLAGTAVAGRAA